MKKNSLKFNNSFDLFINLFMKDGKKVKARNFFFKSIFFLKKKVKKDPIFLIEEALKNAQPLIFLKKKKIKGKSAQIPHIHNENTRKRIGAKWLLEHAKIASKKGQKLPESFCNIIIETSKNKGSVVKYRESFHSKVLENKSLLRFWP